ncbi:MAG: LamG-like jellyroll fold domain-containing protein [Pirellulaceae bacterium]
MNLSLINNDGLRLQLQLSTDNAHSSLTSDRIDIAPGQWSHAAVTYDGTNAKLFVNGSEVAIASQTGTVKRAAPVVVGTDRDAVDRFSGKIDRVRVYSRALEPQELQVLIDQDPPKNEAPTVQAGANQVVQLSQALELSGASSDDALPFTSRTQTNWTQLQGPGTAAFADASKVNTSVTFDAAGDYVLQLLASDGMLATTDQITVKVVDSSSLLADWTMNEGSGATIQDSSPWHRNGVVQGPTWTNSGQSGSGFISME